MKTISYILALSIALLCSLSHAETTTAPIDSESNPETTCQPPTRPAPSCRLWNLQDADILSIINEVSLETGKNFVVDPRVTGKITLISSKPIKPDDVYNVFLSVLSSLGYSAIPSGDVIKIVPNMESSEYATRVATSRAPGRGDEVVVRVIPLENASANQLIPVIRPLLPQWGNISAYTPGNVLIIVGRAGNLQRIMSIINNIERAADTNIEMIPLHYASAAQIVTVLNNLQSAARASGETAVLSIAADERSNSILLSGNKAARVRMRMLISQLDSPTTCAQGNIEVVYLRYLIAKDFAPILSKIAQSLMGKGSLPPTEVSSSVSVQQNYGGTAATTSTKTKEESITNIQAEPRTNSLIITAQPVLMRSLNDIIAKLDLRPAQVLIEGIIVEINQTDLANLGIQWGGLVNSKTTQPPPPFSQFGLGVVGIIPHQQIQAILSLLQTNQNVNILSTPSVVVLDNHLAILDIGQDVPTQSGSYATTTGNTVAPFNTIAYKKVALTLSVKPQINLGDAVRLTVKLKNDSLQNPSNPGLTPIFNTSQINNSVLINSCDILVIGGLIRNTLNDADDKIPILGDLPIVGTLFRHQVRTLQKENLVVFLKPVILRNEIEANAITYNKYQYARQTEINYPEDISRPGRQKMATILPLWKNPVKLPRPFDG